ncbi:MAG: helix-turn-helix domain-containing protein [Sedimentisphaerales bacterium]|nr:helix-turn-helix domain-containing protein [Sedimentisphaerales bacterium]
MAGMFYSLKEAAEKLGKSEEEVKAIVKQGRLREFRDGPNLLFKVDEVASLLSDSSVIGAQSSPEEPQKTEEEIELLPEGADESGSTAGLTEADTIAAGDETSLLGQTDGDYELTEDASQEVKKSAQADETTLEKIDEDVNLDTFGSGSGLLDLSLQADDTSLGGILDEIYAPESEQGQVPAEDSAMEAAVEAEQIMPEEITPVQASVILSSAEPDASSNTFGIMLFLPLIVIIYTALVTVSGFNGLMPIVLEKTQGIILYILGAALAVAVIMTVAGLFYGSERAKAPKKTKTKTKEKKKKKKGGKAAAESEPKAT